MSVTWELLRNWRILRYLVFYLVEDLVPPGLVTGRDVVDFSCGLGDLSAYMLDQNPRSLTATAPDDIAAPDAFADKPEIKFLPRVMAHDIDHRLPVETFDLFVARMVFQFPTEEQDCIDVDGMSAQVYRVLRPGGRLIVCSHEFTELDDRPESWGLPLDKHFEQALSERNLGRRQGIEALVELFRTIGVPPREGVHAQTGFGLKALMMVDSFVQAGFLIESCAEIEDFTFPVGISRDLSQQVDAYELLAKKVFAIKKEKILSPAFRNKYRRPRVLQEILLEIGALHRFVTVPIFRIQARKPA